MSTQPNQVSYQQLGNGVYRVSGAVRRSALTGRYITTTSKSAKQKSSDSSKRSSKGRSNKRD